MHPLNYCGSSMQPLIEGFQLAIEKSSVWMVIDESMPFVSNHSRPHSYNIEG